MIDLRQFNITYRPYGNSAILVEWPQEIKKNILNDVLNFKKKVSDSYIEVKVEIINTYNSLTIIYVSGIENIYNEISILKSLYKYQDTQNLIKAKLWKIPVCYDEKFGIDLEDISKKNELSISEIIRLHSSQNYQVYFIGFLPGFLYLGGLDQRLHFLRKENPRMRVEKGTVAIGGSQTGIYPQQSAGGWNIIGNSPISFFDRKNIEPCFAKPSDYIQFVPISVEEHEEISNLVAYKRYKVESEVLDA